MANIKLGALIADIRGSIGGTTFSRGGGGAIARNNPKPCNPRSAAQSTRRANLAYLSQLWASTSMATYRNGWMDYAAGTNWTNKVGTQALITGLAAFVRLNSIELLIGNPVRLAAPTELGHAGTPTFTLLADGADLSLKVSQPTAPWVNNANEYYIAFFAYAPVSAGRVSLANQRLYLGTAASSSGAPPAWPKSMTSSFQFSNGQNISVAGVMIDPDFRMSGIYVASAVAATP